MSLAMLARKHESEGSSKATGPVTTSGLRIDPAGSALEGEADRVADAIMAGRGAVWSLARMNIGTPPLQRTCDCGGSGGSCEACEERRKLQRKGAGTGTLDYVSPLVDEVLGAPGMPLDQATRSFFEPRFGHDLGSIRIHTDSRAAESAKAVDALAYTVGHHIVFGGGRYSPWTASGKKLLAHELTHTQQQRGVSDPLSSTPRLDHPSSHAEAEAARHAAALTSAGPPVHAGRERATGPVVSRACLSEQTCKTKSERTPEELMKEETSKPENKEKRERRKKACKKVPRDPSCTADGHGQRAVQAEKVLHDYDPARLKFIKRIVVDKDMEAAFGGLTGECAGFMPPIPGGGICTLIPDRIEKESAQFNNTMDPEIGGLPRDLWRDRTLSILEHETGHAAFDVHWIPRPRPAACKFPDIQDALSEIVAMMAEFPVIFRGTRENVSLTPERKEEILNKWFFRRITNDFQSFKSTLHAIYCKCECADAAAYVTKTIEFATKDWSQTEKIRFHTELQDPKWSAHDLRWPVAPPVTPPQTAAAPSQAATAPSKTGTTP
jgi:hypothetical protein